MQKKLACAALFLLCCAPLLAGVNGPWLLDDYSNIVLEPALSPDHWSPVSFLEAVWSNDSGPTGRPVAMFTFALNAMLTGLSPFWFKLGNILLHAFAALAVMLFVRQMMLAFRDDDSSANTTAFATALLWGVHPIAATSTLYVVQRMNLLAALFTLLSLTFYLAARTSRDNGNGRNSPRAQFAISAGLACLAVFSKENGALIPVYIGLLEVLVIRETGLFHRLRQRPTVMAAAAVAGPAMLAALGYFVASLQAGYAARPFSISERLFTEARVVWRYIEMILLPLPGNVGLFLDDIPLSKNLFEPVTTLLSVAGVATLLAFTALARDRWRLPAFGIALFLGGHLLESTIIPLEIAHEHRNYLPMIGILFAVVTTLQNLVQDRGITSLLVIGAASVFAVLAGFRSLNWSAPYLFAQYSVQYHENSPRAQMEMAKVFADRAFSLSPLETTRRQFYRDAVNAHLEIAQELSPGAVTPYLVQRAYRCRLADQGDESEIDDELLRQKLGHSSPDPLTPSVLNDLVGKIISGECLMSPQSLWALIAATLENPQLHGSPRASMLIVASNFAKYIARDEDMSLYYLAGAVHETPRDARIRYLLAERLVQLERFEDAAEELEKIPVSLSSLSLITRTNDLKSEIHSHFGKE